MVELKTVMYYIIKNYPNRMKKELSNARLTKMIYLSDWKKSINEGKQITNIEWYFDNYGPFVGDVLDEAEKNKDVFSIKHTINMYGQPKTYFEIKENSNMDKEIEKIHDKTKDVLDYIINITSKMYWNAFIKLVYSTYPITSSERYSKLNLVKKAKEYAQFKKLNGEE